MAVVVAPEDVDKFLGFAAEENLEAVAVATVTEEPRLVLNWRGKKIVDLKRAFLDTNGAHQETAVRVDIPDEKGNYFDKIAVPAVEKALEKEDVKAAWLALLNDLNVCSQKGLQRIYALWWKISVDRNPDHGGKASGIAGKDRYRYHDELRL